MSQDLTERSCLRDSRGRIRIFVGTISNSGEYLATFRASENSRETERESSHLLHRAEEKSVGCIHEHSRVQVTVGFVVGETEGGIPSELDEVIG